MEFGEKLIKWYKKQGRDLPWRLTKNPYHIWLSEIILQQTRVIQGLEYYQKFVNQYPEITDLASADLQEVLKLWQGLGYYSRARNLHHTANDIVENYNGVFPKKYSEIQKLKGVGPYTAAAIASFAYDESVAVVDGNVFRVLSRFFGIKEDISITKTRKTFQELANMLIKEVESASFNQAIMDFGATVCKPQNPLCDSCIFSQQCFAYSRNEVEKFPVKSKKIAIKKRFFHYLINENTDEIYISKRIENDIWKGLYELPKIEENKPMMLQEIQSKLSEKFQIPEKEIFILKENIIHKLTHQQLIINFWKTSFLIEMDCEKILKKQLDKYPFPIVIWKEIFSEN